MKMKKRKYKVNIEKLADFFKDKYRYEIAEIFGVAPPTITKLFKNPVCSLKLARKIAQLVPEAVQPIEEEEK
jgi:DNA-binding XRE family transcriptional regulator